MIEDAERHLRAFAADEAPGLAEAALALAVLEGGPRDMAPYRDHLAALAADLSREAESADAVAGCAVALCAVLYDRHGYHGDTETYDDLANADLTRVIDRRRGLPVSLGILAAHAARAQGWGLDLLAFPSHVLMRLECCGQRLILDPFDRAQVLSPADLRAFAKRTCGLNTEVQPAFFQAMDDRQILLRLQNNIKMRRLKAGDFAGALAVVDRMRLLAPDEAALWREAGELHARLGDFPSAIQALQGFVDRSGEDRAKHAVSALLNELKNALHSRPFH